MPYDFDKKVSDPVKASLNAFIAQCPGRKLVLEAEYCMGLRATTAPQHYTVVNRDVAITAKAASMGAAVVTGEWDDVVFAEFMRHVTYDVIFADFCSTIKDLAMSRLSAHLMSDILTANGVLLVTYCTRGVPSTHAKALEFLEEKYTVLMTVPNTSTLTFVCMHKGAKGMVQMTRRLLESLQTKPAPFYWQGASQLHSSESPVQCAACQQWCCGEHVVIDDASQVCMTCWTQYHGLTDACTSCRHRPVPEGVSICMQCRPRLTHNAPHMDAFFAALSKAGCPLSRVQIESCFRASLKVTIANIVRCIRKALQLFKPATSMVRSKVGEATIVFGRLNMSYFWDGPTHQQINPLHAVGISGEDMHCHHAVKAMPVEWLRPELADAYLFNTTAYRFDTRK